MKLALILQPAASMKQLSRRTAALALSHAFPSDCQPSTASGHFPWPLSCQQPATNDKRCHEPTMPKDDVLVPTTIPTTSCLKLLCSDPPVVPRVDSSPTPRECGYTSPNDHSMTRQTAARASPAFLTEDCTTLQHSSRLVAARRISARSDNPTDAAKHSLAGVCVR